MSKQLFVGAAKRIITAHVQTANEVRDELYVPSDYGSS